MNPHIFIAFPATDSLFDPDKGSLWPKTVSGNKRLRLLAHHRKELISRLDRAYKLIPQANMDIEDAAASRLVDEQDIAALYEALTRFLVDDDHSERLLLYFPIELIPRRDWKPRTDKLAAAKATFIESYLSGWRNLLALHDLCANFIDGDIPEVEIRTGPLPSVVKAAHLIPALIGKGLLSMDEVLELKKTKDAVLAESIEDALSDAPKRPRNTRLLRASTETRLKWLVRQGDLESIEKHSNEFAKKLTEGSILPEALIRITLEKSTKAIMVETAIVSFRKALEKLASIDKSKARDAYLLIEPFMDELWQRGDVVLMKQLESAWSRLAVAGIADKEKLEKRGVKTPAFDGEPMENTLKAAEELASIAEAIRADANLAKFILPAVIGYGSRIKGYGALDADLDIAVFVRPSTAMTDREAIQSLLAKVLEPLGIKGKPMEFWLDEGGTNIRDFPAPDRSLGDSTLVHVLFGGVWAGDEASIRGLYEKVLSPYLVSKAGRILGRKAQEVWLEEIERDILQYRLLHKGYAHFYPECRTAYVPKSMADSAGSFWDSGYRRVATKLFLKKVFLPKLGR